MREVRIYGFDWAVYASRIMPAFERWLIEEDDKAILELYAGTKCAREEEHLPRAMIQSRTWARAQAFVKQLPRGEHMRREYELLCNAEQYTVLSDNYIYKHSPRLYQNLDALRSVWGATVEEYCLTWLSMKEKGMALAEARKTVLEEPETSRGEMVSLLQAAGLDELITEVGKGGEERQVMEQGEQWTSSEEEAVEQEEKSESAVWQGLEIGVHPAALHLRGWLAGTSVRAMALFEYLACGRRNMPFGCRTGEPYEAYIGYLMPEEVWQLALCLRDLQAPDPEEAEKDYVLFRTQRMNRTNDFRMIDEVLPTHAEELLQAVQGAVQVGLGLICSAE